MMHGRAAHERSSRVLRAHHVWLVAWLAALAPLEVGAQELAQGVSHLTSEICAQRPDGSEVCVDACASFLGDRPQAEGFGTVTRWTPDHVLAPLAIRDAAGVPWTHTLRGVRRSRTRTAVPGLAHVATLVSTPRDACAVDDTGAVWCWGLPMRPRVEGGSALGPTPIRVEGIDDAVALALDVETQAAPPALGEPPRRSACATTRAHGVLCWSWLVERAREAPALVARAVPLTDGATDVTTTAISAHEVCALRPDGVVVCWQIPLVVVHEAGCGAEHRRCAIPSLTPVVAQHLPEPIASVEDACVLGATPERHAYCLGVPGRATLWSAVPELDGSVEIRAARGWSDGTATCALDAAGAVRCRYWVSRDECR